MFSPYLAHGRVRFLLFMKGPSGRNVGPSLDWLRETRERAEGKLPQKSEASSSWKSSGGTSWGSDEGSWKTGGGRSWGDDGATWKAGGGRSWNAEEDGNWKQAGEWSRSEEDTSSRSVGRDAGKTKGKGKGKASSASSEQVNENSSRYLVENAPRRNRSRSASSSSSRPKRTRRKGLWDSTVEAPEVKKPPPTAAAPKKKRDGLVIEAGVKVEIHGLVGSAQYNGCEGKVIAGPNEKGRWKVEVLFEGSLKEMALQPSNMEPKPTCGWELVVAGLRELSAEQDVAAAFASFGRVESCKVTRDLNGHSKGVALVVMTAKASAESALQFNSEIRVNGIPITLQWSTMVKQQMGLLKNRDEEMGKDESSTSRKFHEQPTQASTTKPTPFDIGQSVTIVGLKGAPQYNGVLAKVHSFREDGRCEVTLNANGEAKTLALKVENLSVTSESASGNDHACNGNDSNVESSGEAPRRRRFRDAPEQTTDCAATQPQAETSTTTGEAAEPRRRRRGWDDGQTAGYVYVNSNTTENDGAKVESRSEEDIKPLPDETSLNEMSAKELRKLLMEHNINISGCFEKAEFLEKALAARSQTL